MEFELGLEGGIFAEMYGSRSRTVGTTCSERAFGLRGRWAVDVLCDPDFTGESTFLEGDVLVEFEFLEGLRLEVAGMLIVFSPIKAVSLEVDAMADSHRHL